MTVPIFFCDNCSEIIEDGISYYGVNFYFPDGRAELPNFASQRWCYKCVALQDETRKKNDRESIKALKGFIKEHKKNLQKEMG